MKLRNLLNYVCMETLICVRKNSKEYKGTREDVIGDNIWLDHEIINIGLLTVTEEQETESYICIEVEE